MGGPTLKRCAMHRPASVLTSMFSLFLSKVSDNCHDHRATRHGIGSAMRRCPTQSFFCLGVIVCTPRCSRIIPLTSANRTHHMVTPDYKSFLQLSRDASLIPVAKTLSADLLTPVGAFLRDRKSTRLNSSH